MEREGPGIVLRPTLMPLGDHGLLIRFSGKLDEAANRAAIRLAHKLEGASLPGVREVVPNLVSVLLRYDPRRIGFAALAGEVRLLTGPIGTGAPGSINHTAETAFGGENGPDLQELATHLNLTADQFIEQHCASMLHVLATGFAPGFVYCGFHPAALHVPRRTAVRDSVPAGSVLFAAGQTAIASTAIPTGWHVIGRTSFRNFEPEADPPTRLRAGDSIRFVPK